MIINHPLLGPRDAAEFVYKGDASLIARPDGMTASDDEMHDYMYLRDNPAGPTEDLWYHAGGCGAWLVVSRNTVTHAIDGARLLRERRA